MPSQPSRRALLTSTFAGAAAVAVAASGTSTADAVSAPAATANHPLPASHDLALHAARRLSFGATPALVADIRKAGLMPWLDEQLSMGTDLKGTLHGLGIGSLPLPTVLTGALAAFAGHNTVQDLQSATIARALYADNQVYELMVEFWSNHLSINANAENVGVYKVADDRDVVRPHALGKFSDLLKASAQSPAMLKYLNNDISYGREPNENYARELLELHTVGVHGGYRQADVHNAALVLTGMTVDNGSGMFAFVPSYHATGHVTVMGWSSANASQKGGKDVALSLVSYLAHHPATAKRIATKLVRRLVSDNPPAGLVASAARVYLDNDTAISPVIKHIVGSADFARSAGQKTQRPFEWFTASVRVLGRASSLDPNVNSSSLVYLTQLLAQAPFEWVQPDGYPDVSSAWGSTASMLTRWNLAISLVYSSIGGLGPVDVDGLIGTTIPPNAGALVDRLSTVLLGAAPRPALRQAVLHGVAQNASRPLSQSVARSLALPMSALLLSSPEAQVR